MVKRMTLFAVAITALAWAVPALGAEITRDEYVEAVEPICKTDTEANKRVLTGVRAKVKAGKLDAASKQFAAAARALKRARTQIAAVDKPPADAAGLTKWLGYVKTEVGLFEAVSRKLAKGEATAAQKMVVRLVRNANRANDQVLLFEFNYCRLQPAKFI